jgi:zeaxanthin glucosyltransferase
VSRFLLVVPPLTGHVNPAAGVGNALAGRGHEVAWVCSETFIRPLVGPRATVYRTGTRLYRPLGDRGLAGLKSLWEGFIVPFARFTRPTVETAIEAYRPDVIVVDQHALAGAIAARRCGLCWASLAPGSMELTRPYRALPKVDAWISGHCASLCAEAGLPPDETFDPRFSPHLVLACTTAALTHSAVFPDHYALVWPMLADRAAEPDFPWDRLHPGRRLVLVTMGTLSAEIAKDFYSRAVAALRPLGDRLQAIVVAPDGAVPNPPPHILAMPQVPLLELMPHLDAVVCHGGMNTVGEALAHGVPLVIAPIRHDQPVTAAQVAEAGAGIRVRFARVTAAQLRTAVTAVLDDTAYRSAARRVEDSFAAAGGVAAAAEHLEQLARSITNQERPVSGPVGPSGR